MDINKTGILGNIVGSLGSTVKKTGEQMVKLPRDMAEKAAEQGNVKQPATTADKSATQEIVKGLYEKSKKPTEFEKQIVNKSPEEQKKLRELRDKLHKETYYEPTFNPVKKQEERPAEKVEREKKQEMQDLQKKEAKKPPPLAVQRARNKAEMFPGTSG